MATVEQAKAAVQSLETELGSLRRELAKVDADLAAKPAATVEAEVRRLEPLTVRKLAIANLLTATEGKLATARVDLAAAEAEAKRARIAAHDAAAEALLDELRTLAEQALGLAVRAAEERKQGGNYQDAEAAIGDIRRLFESLGAKTYQHVDGPFTYKWGD